MGAKIHIYTAAKGKLPPEQQRIIDQMVVMLAERLGIRGSDALILIGEIAVLIAKKCFRQ